MIDCPDKGDNPRPMGDDVRCGDSPAVQPVIGVAVAIGAWVVLSIPAALLLAQFVGAQTSWADEPGPSVIPDSERRPLPPHLRQTETV